MGYGTAFESRRECARFSVDSPSEAIVTLVRATDFKSVGGCGDTASAGSIPVRFRHFACQGALLPRLPRTPVPSEIPPERPPVGCKGL